MSHRNFAIIVVVLPTVGSRGSVLSLELRDDHHRVAVKNYNRWRASWCVRRGEEWPDNVHFVRTDLCSASSLLAGQGFNAVSTRLGDTPTSCFSEP